MSMVRRKWKVVAVRVQIVSPSKRGRMLLVMEPRLKENEDDFFVV